MFFKDKTQEIGQIVAVGGANGYVLNMKNVAGQTVTRSHTVTQSILSFRLRSPLLLDKTSNGSGYIQVQDVTGCYRGSLLLLDKNSMQESTRCTHTH